MLSDLLVTRGSPLARQAEVRRFFWGEQVPGFPHTVPTAWPAPARSGIDLAGNGAARWSGATRTELGTSFPMTRALLKAFFFPRRFFLSCPSLLPARHTLDPGSSAVQADMAGCRFASHNFHPTVFFFPVEFQLASAQPGCAVPGGRGTSLY